MNPENNLLFDAIPEVVYTLEIPKLPARSDGTAVWKWLRFLQARRREEFEMLAKQNPEMREAVDTLYRISASDKIRAKYEMREKAWRDREAQIDYGIEKGREEGRAEGREEGRAEGREEGMAKGIEKGRAEGKEQTVRNLLKENMPLETIARIAELPVEKVDALAKEFDKKSNS